jgi:sugar/nucleoside kinase (ribokinase family)
METLYDAVIAGYTCVDLIPEFKKYPSKANIFDLLKPGNLIEIEGMDFVLGGVVPNTGLAMKRFGKKIAFNGLIGNDNMGKIAEQKLASYGGTEGMVVTNEANTAFSIVISPPGVDRIFLESVGCNQIFNINHINFGMISKARMFHFGYPPLMRQFFLDDGRQLIQMYAEIHKMGVITSLDFSLPDPESESGNLNWKRILGNTLPFVDIFAPSLEELVQLMMPKKHLEIKSAFINSNFEDHVPLYFVRKLGKQIISLGAKILLLKMGKRGIYLFTGDISQVNKKLGNTLQNNQWSFQEILCNAYSSKKSKVKNASGAGDIAVAAFLTSILNANNVEKALRYSSIAGRDSIYCNNNYEDLPDWNQLTCEINSESNESVYFNEIH